MKTIKLLTILNLMPLMAICQNQIKVESRINEVTVFLNQAQLSREIKAKIQPGNSQIVLKGLSAYLDAQSIQVTGTGDAVITGVKHQQNYLADQEMPGEVKILKDSVNYYDDQIKGSKDMIDVLTKEESMLISNQVIGGKDKNITVIELSAMSDFYRKRLIDIRKLKHDEEGEIKYNTRRLAVISSQLNELQKFYRKNTSEIIIDVQSNQTSNINLLVSYIVGNAGWQPLYDIRSAGVNSPMQLGYKANVYQNTGVNWDNVKLNLSTTNPTLGGIKPELLRWYLDFPNPLMYQNALRGKAAGVQLKSEPAVVYDNNEMEMVMDKLEEVVTVADYTQTVQTSLATIFNISLPYSIPTSGKPVAVDIQSNSIDAHYVYSAVPKLDGDVFLLAKIADWGNYNIMPGEANVFFEGAYVGKTYINPGRSGDTLNLSLGRDKRIVVERKRLEDFTSSKLIGTNKKESYAFEIMVKNTRNTPVELIIEDQIPISKNNEIEVEVLDVSGANYDNVEGKLTWPLKLKAGESKSVRYMFEVKYPKNKEVYGL